MKKLFLVSITLLTLTACGVKEVEETHSNTEVSSSVSETTIATVKIVVDGEEIDSKTTAFTKGDTVHDITESTFEITLDGEFITGVSGIEQSPSENKWWVFEVNDEMVNTGAMDTIVESDDDIVWELVQF